MEGKALSGPFSFERLATSPPQADHVLVDLFLSMAARGALWAEPHTHLCTPVFIAAQFIIPKCWKQPRCPSVNEWIKKLWYSYIVEYYGAERKKELLLESIMLSEISQVVTDKYYMISPISRT